MGNMTPDPNKYGCRPPALLRRDPTLSRTLCARGTVCLVVYTGYSNRGIEAYCGLLGIGSNRKNYLSKRMSDISAPDLKPNTPRNQLLDIRWHIKLHHNAIPKWVIDRHV